MLPNTSIKTKNAAKKQRKDTKKERPPKSESALF